uniref:Sodium channel regulatory subunit beta-3 n=1 Tax=Nothobranchius furzeri TaxID=105023 RepID=A0A8C6KS83_NOTFU
MNTDVDPIQRKASPCDAGCAEVDSLTEAVAGEGFLLGCISCKKREEVSAWATVDWYFRSKEEDEFSHIFHYDHPTASILDEAFSERLQWRGTLDQDIQVGAVYIQNITFNDTGTYRCTFHRTLFLPRTHCGVTRYFVFSAKRGLVSVVAEIMMYVLIVVLQLWLIAVLVYCYKKIWNEHEDREAKKAQKAQEMKDNCTKVQTKD